MAKKPKTPKRVYMTSLSSVLHLPPEIKNVAKPSNPLNRYKKIGPFVLWNLSQALLSDPHYEASVYGAFNSYLIAIYPLDRYFLIKPQGMIRPVLAPLQAPPILGDVPDGGGTGTDPGGGGFAESGSRNADQDEADHGLGDGHDDNPDGDDDGDGFDLDEDEADVSFGSYMGEHSKRGRGREVGKDFVDFVVVKVVICDDPTTKCHIPVLLVEVKKSYDIHGTAHAKLQMTRYMSDMASQKTCPPDLVGYLVQGRIGIRFHLVPRLNGTLKPAQSPQFDILDDDTMTPELVRIAHDNWGILTMDEEVTG